MRHTSWHSFDPWNLGQCIALLKSQKGVVISQEKRCGVTDNVAAKSSIYIGGSINGGVPKMDGL